MIDTIYNKIFIFFLALEQDTALLSHYFFKTRSLSTIVKRK